MNGIRGEAAVILAGETRKVCLTLGALAEIETALGTVGVEGLAARMRNLCANDLMVVLAALLRGGGEDGLAQTLARSQIGVDEAAAAIVAGFEASV